MPGLYFGYGGYGQLETRRPSSHSCFSEVGLFSCFDVLSAAIKNTDPRVTA